MPSIQDLAAELGIDLSAAKPEAVSKWNTYLSDADTKYKSAEQMKAEAEANLAKLQEEQNEINGFIEQYGASQTTLAALEANNAAMKAQLEAFQKNGFNVEIPAKPIVPGSPATGGNAAPKNGGVDEQQIYSRVGNVMSQAFDLNNKHLALFGKPIPDSMESLAEQARAVRKPLQQFIAEKYNFAGEEKRRAAEEQKKHDDEVAAAAVKKFQEEHPPVGDNPFMRPGSDSRYGQILKPRDPKDLHNFAGLSAKEKIAKSVARSRELIQENQG